jgi:FAD/FMN-containing dehydrogenase
MTQFVATGQQVSDYGEFHRSCGDYLEYRPANLSELQDAVLDANRRGLPIRTRGNGHSMNGTAVPHAGELLLRTAGLDRYCFEAAGTITVGAGAAVWDVHKLVGKFGYDLMVYNDGDAAAPSVGGYVAAAGFGIASRKYGGFWETVVALTLVSGDGGCMTVRPGDALFPWLFGSMGQLGIVAEATLRLVPLEASEPVYPEGCRGRIVATRHEWEKLAWYTVFASGSRWTTVIQELASIGRRYAPGWSPRPPYAYALPFRTFTPPLLHPGREDLVAVGIWGDAPPRGFDPDRLGELDRAITAWLRENPDCRRYAQTELLLEDFDYRSHFGPSLARFAELKHHLDPGRLLVPGVLAAAAVRRATGTEMKPDTLAPRLDAHVAAALLPYRAAGLISPACRERVAKAAALLPASASSFFGFECRLGETDAFADFLACIAAGGGEREAWVRSLRPAAAGGSRIWSRLTDVARDWADPASELHTPITNIWVEFDLAGSSADPRVPSVFLGSDQLGPERSDAAGHAWLIAAMARLSGAPLGTERRRIIGNCIAALPTRGRLFQTGMMLSRSDPVLRLCLRGLAANDLPDYLGQIGWRGPVAALRALLGTLVGLADEILLDIDIGAAALGSKIGLECYIDANERLWPRLSAFLDHLRHQGLCTEIKAQALAAWYGLTHERWCRERWPADLRDRAGRPGSGHSGGFVRTVHHIKITFDPPAPLEAKAYLAARFVWVDDAALKRELVQRAATGADQS